MKDDEMKHLFDLSAITTAFASLFDFLPHVSSLLAVVWLGLRIFESRTIQSMLLGKEPPKTREKDDES